MARYHRAAKGGTARQGGDNGSFWISFSDLMSAIVLVFVLILFYCMYQYFDMLEVKTAELLRQSGLLDEKEAALTQSEEELAAAQLALDEQSAKLTEAEKASLEQQAKLLLQQQTLDALSAQLKDQEVSLNEAIALQEAAQAQLALQQAQLRDQQTQLASQQTLLEQQQTQMEFQQAQLDKLVGVRAELIADLIAALQSANITGASVDDSGAIVFDTSMMFDTGAYKLKDVGKDFLASFIPSYLSVLMSEEYSPYVSQIIIEGHTDIEGSFQENMTLSLNRANAVLRYILSGDFTGISNAAKLRLQQIVTVNGRSYSDPILNADGSVNMDASRRVVIKFRLNDEEMVNQMLDVLQSIQ